VTTGPSHLTVWSSLNYEKTACRWRCDSGRRAVDGLSQSERVDFFKVGGGFPVDLGAKRYRGKFSRRALLPTGAAIKWQESTVI